MTFRLPKPGLKCILLCDASYDGSSFGPMVEVYVETGEAGGKKDIHTAVLWFTGVKSRSIQIFYLF